jgi:hypothetical protein
MKWLRMLKARLERNRRLKRLEAEARRIEQRYPRVYALPSYGAFGMAEDDYVVINTNSFPYKVFRLQLEGDD